MKTIHRVRGITLLELMVSVAIVGILASIVYPSYQRSVLKANRTEAKTELMKSAEDLGRCYGRYNYKYDNLSCTVNGTAIASATAITTYASRPSGKYSISGVLTAQTFSLTATPQGGQANDTLCGNLTYNERNERGVSTSTDPTVIAKCW